MNTHLIALQLMAAQGLLGAFDTLYHHELTEALAQRASARKELGIHAVRALIYSLLFIGLSAWVWQGNWSIVLLLVFGVEIVLTLWDFVIEDQTRLLPATERVTHTILAINGGAFITLLVLCVFDTQGWWQAPTYMSWQPHGWLSVFLALCGAGVGISGVRDGLAALRLGKLAIKERGKNMIHFSDQSEQVLVTGATGFIGTLLVKALLADGQQVTVLSRNPKQANWKFDGKVKAIATMQDLPANQRVDVIINLAGERILGWRWSEKRKAELRQSRTGLTKQIIEWINKADSKPRLLLAASAIGYYGIQARGDDRELTENAEPQSIFMSELCQEWEQANQAASTCGVKVARMRLGVVLGQQGALGMMLLPIKLGLGGALGSGKQWQSWIHVHDVLRGIAHIWQHEASLPLDSTYNFTAPESVTQKQFSTIAARVLRRPCILPTPAWPMRLMLGEQADLLLEGQRVAPARLLEEGFRFDYPDLRSALKDLI
ncbi:TIGR01777 family oxidoreductase [Undibacterium sp. Ji49W]|uniref:TIGR01777 family oxidoreductase n=1 Tax=Undibacterium sp. Ji49W TaxID=3413040 RepID=UPI003BF00D51